MIYSIAFTAFHIAVAPPFPRSVREGGIGDDSVFPDSGEGSLYLQLTARPSITRSYDPLRDQAGPLSEPRLPPLHHLQLLPRDEVARHRCEAGRFRERTGASTALVRMFHCRLPGHCPNTFTCSSANRSASRFRLRCRCSSRSRRTSWEETIFLAFGKSAISIFRCGARPSALRSCVTSIAVPSSVGW
jgi:hypothetical protein